MVCSLSWTNNRSVVYLIVIFLIQHLLLEQYEVCETAVTAHTFHLAQTTKNGVRLSGGVSVDLWGTVCLLWQRDVRRISVQNSLSAATLPATVAETQYNKWVVITGDSRGASCQSARVHSLPDISGDAHSRSFSSSQGTPWMKMKTRWLDQTTLSQCAVSWWYDSVSLRYPFFWRVVGFFLVLFLMVRL